MKGVKMRFSKQERVDYIKNEIKKAEHFLIENRHLSKELQIYYNERIDMLIDILATVNQ